MHRAVSVGHIQDGADSTGSYTTGGKKVVHRSRSPSGALVWDEDADAFVPKPLDSIPSQPSALPVERGARRGVGVRRPCSTSVSWGVGDLLPEPEASGSMPSSSLSSWYGSYLGLEGEPLARDRTTSPLQIGQVRLLVVNHGVLKMNR